jgi:TolB-like protein
MIKHNKVLAGIFSTMLVFGMAGGLSAQTVSLDEAIKGAADDLGKNLPKGSKIAVLNFTGGSDRLSTYVIEELNSAVVNGRLITAVDRAQLDLVRQEMNFQMSGEVSDESAQEIGKMLGAQYIVSGSIDNIGNTYRFRISAIEVESAAIQVSYSANIQNDQMLAVLMGTSESAPNPNTHQGLSTGGKIGTGFMNIAFGLGSFTTGDWAGGLTILGGYVVAGGLIAVEVGALSYDNALVGVPGNIGLGVAGVALLYGFIRPFLYQQNVATALLNVLDGVNVAVFPDSTGVRAVRMTYTKSF